MRTRANQPGGRLTVELAISDDDIRQSLRLRHQVFVEEMGAIPHPDAEHGLESDPYDPYCHHMLVRDQNSGRVVASTRILTDTQARLAGGFYSENEFEMDTILALSGRVMEIGRTCVHPDYRNGATIAMLWSGLAQFMDVNRFSYLIGCASISLSDHGVTAGALMRQLHKHLAGDAHRVVPRLPLPTDMPARSQELRLPPLLKAYMRLGANICGEPCWDPAFNTADLFVLLDVDNLQRRYQRHFIHRDPGMPVHQLNARSAA